MACIHIVQQILPKEGNLLNIDTKDTTTTCSINQAANLFKRHHTFATVRKVDLSWQAFVAEKSVEMPCKVKTCEQENSWQGVRE